MSLRAFLFSILINSDKIENGTRKDDLTMKQIMKESNSNTSKKKFTKDKKNLVCQKCDCKIKNKLCSQNELTNSECYFLLKI